MIGIDLLQLFLECIPSANLLKMCCRELWVFIDNPLLRWHG